MGTDLGGIAINRLPSAKDQVVVAQLFDGPRERVRSSQRIRTGELPVADQNHPVRTPVEGLAQHLRRLGRPHRHDGDLTTILLPDLKRHLQRVQIFRVENGR